MKTILTQEDRIDLIRHLNILLDDIERDEGEVLTFNSMNRIKTKITSRFNIMLDETFK